MTSSTATTSGSSGIPKGVEIAHGALSRYLAATEASYIVRPGDRFLEFASLSFDSSLEEMLNPLCAGATVVIRTDEMLDSPAIFADRCRSLRLTHLSLPTAFWHELVAADWPEDLDLGPDLRVLLVGGEAMSSDAFRRWKRVTRPGIDLINGYGPTEVTIAATYVVLSRDEERDAGIPIGCPFPGYTVFVRDARGEPLPIGAAGELWVGGPNLALGYLGDPQLTASRFVTDVATGGTGARFYRTGDRVRWRGDGRLAFLGRTDLQLKVRGYRIEPADIERVLQEVAGVRQVAVIAQRGPGGDRLVAFVVPEGVAAVEMKVLTDAATRELPAYMVPSQFVMLARLPISSTGKVDRAALAALVPGQAVMAGGTITTPTEQAVVRIWESQFGISGIGADDSFFALGGHSLLAMRMVDRLRVELSIDVTIRTILMHPTVASLARELDRIGEAAGPESTAEPIPRAPRVPRPAPRDGL